MDSYTSYELKALMFHRMTGHMAPGKDPASASYPAPFEVREEAWVRWCTDNKECINAMLYAVGEYFQDELELDKVELEMALKAAERERNICQSQLKDKCRDEWRSMFEQQPYAEGRYLVWYRQKNIERVFIADWVDGRWTSMLDAEVLYWQPIQLPSEQEQAND